MERITRFLRYYFLRLTRLRGSLHELSLGAALGAAVSCTPTIPLHTLIILLIGSLFRINLLAAIIVSTLICNPLTIVPIYYLCWRTGNFIFPHRLHWEHIHRLVFQIEEAGFLSSFVMLRQVGKNTALVMLTGGIVLAVPVAILVYILTRHFLLRSRQKRYSKHVLK